MRQCLVLTPMRSTHVCTTADFMPMGRRKPYNEACSALSGREATSPTARMRWSRPWSRLVGSTGFGFWYGCTSERVWGRSGCDAGRGRTPEQYSRRCSGVGGRPGSAREVLVFAARVALRVVGRAAVLQRGMRCALGRNLHTAAGRMGEVCVSARCGPGGNSDADCLGVRGLGVALRFSVP